MNKNNFPASESRRTDKISCHQYMRTFFILFLLFFSVAPLSLTARPASPLASEQARGEFIRCVTKEQWVIELFAELRAKIDPVVDNCRENPAWLTSRMAMYWKPGARYTQCYLQNNAYDYSAGDAPVPTVRMPAMRSANNYVNVPLADRRPYNESGDMLALDRRRPYLPAILVPYRQTGDMVTQNNCEILDIALQCALVYSVSGDKIYAKIAANVFWQWLFGTYYMKPPIDATESTGSRAGAEPGGSCGYYAYEVTRDVIQIHAAHLYGLLYDYLERNPHPHLNTLGMSLPQVAGKVFSQFIVTDSMRGEKSGIDNLNVWQCVLPSILALEENSFYENSQGRDFFLSQFLSKSTVYHDALPTALSQFLSKSTVYHDALPTALRDIDPVSGLKIGAPKEILERLSQTLDFTIELQSAGIDLPERIPSVENSFRAISAWCDADGSIPIPGSKEKLTLPPEFWEKLHTFYIRRNDAQAATRIAGILTELQNKKIYQRAELNPILLSYMVNIQTPTADPRECLACFRKHGFLILRTPRSGSDMSLILAGGSEKNLFKPGYFIRRFEIGDTLLMSEIPIADTAPKELTLVDSDPHIFRDEFSAREQLHDDIAFTVTELGSLKNLSVLLRRGNDDSAAVNILRNPSAANQTVFPWHAAFGKNSKSLAEGYVRKSENASFKLTTADGNPDAVCVMLQTTGENPRKDYIFSAENSNKAHRFTSPDASVTGTFAIAAEDSDGLLLLYLGNASAVRFAGYELSSVSDKSVRAVLFRDENGKLRYSADAPVKLKMPDKNETCMLPEAMRVLVEEAIAAPHDSNQL